METGSSEWIRLVQENIKAFDVLIDNDQGNSLAFHAKSLEAWNKKVNLTAIKDPAEIAVKHFLDSLIPVPYLPPDANVLDIGSGGGFPGIPLKILIPSIKVTLIDSVRKKVSFLQYVIRSLNLGNAQALHIRAQELAQKTGFLHSFDVITCRALTAVDKFVLMGLPLVKKGGVLIALKGKVLQEEIDKVYDLGIQGINIEIDKYELPVYKAERAIIRLTCP